MELVENIESITTWYKGLKRDFTGVSDLMYARQRLAITVQRNGRKATRLKGYQKNKAEYDYIVNRAANPVNALDSKRVD